jgi:hypothetical protein
MNYEFHPEAELEVIESAAWYESEVPGLGLEFGEEVERVIELLLENPELGAAATSATSCSGDSLSRSFTRWWAR